MKFEIYDQEKSDEQVLRLKLVYDSDIDGVALVSVYEDGSEEYFLVGITKDGELKRCEGIGKETGLKLDKDGRIKESKD